MKLRISFDRNPRLEPLLDGTVQASGLEFDWDFSEPGGMFLRHLTKNEFDAFEFSISHFLSTRALPNPAYGGWTMVPAFLTKPVFMFHTFHVRTDAGISGLQDLAGKRIGIPDFSMTGGIWLRIMLRVLHGVQGRDITWINTRPDGLRHDAAIGLDHDTATGVRIINIDPDSTPQRMMEQGELDAAIGAHGVPVVEKPGIRPFGQERWLAALGDLNDRTGVIPVNHAVILQRRLLQQRSELASVLLDAFERSKRAAYARDPRARLIFPELGAERQHRLFGDDPYVYGLRANRRALELIGEQLVIDGVIRERPEIEPLIADSTRDT